MKRSLRPKEVAFILLPALGLSAFAWYQYRVEQVGGVRRSDGLYVSSIEVKPNKSRLREMGLSHEIKVAVGHSWPHLGGWEKWTMTMGVDPLVDLRQQKIFGPISPQNVVRYGGVLTTTSIRNGKPVIKVWCRDKRISGPLRSNQLIFSHQLALDKIPDSAGEVTFRGLYLIAGREPLHITRVVRKAGEVSRQPLDRNPHGRIVSITAKAFQQVRQMPANTTADQEQIDFTVSRDVPETEKPQVLVQDLELHDASGKIFKPNVGPGFKIYNAGPSNKISDANTSDPSLWIELASKLKTTAPLILYGKVYIDDAWPIPFSVRLPNR